MLVKLSFCVENWEILRKKAMQAIIFTSAIACFFIFIFWQIFLDNHGEKAGVLCLFSVLLALEQNND